LDGRKARRDVNHQEMAERTSLLLLPALDLASTAPSFSSSYKKTFETLLPRLIPQDNSGTTRLDIGLIPSPSHPVSQPDTSRSSIFNTIQNLLKQTYSLICSVAAAQRVDLDFPGGLDIRLFVLESRIDQIPRESVGKQVLSGPIVDVDTFVLSDRKYGTIYSVEGETGESYLKQFLTTWGTRLKEEPPPIVRLPSGPAIVQNASTGTGSSLTNNSDSAAHLSVAVGGTFDHLHIGHKLLLTGTALALSSSPTSSPQHPRMVTVGITGDALLVNKKYGTHVESWSTRQERTADFVDSILAFYPRKTSPNASGPTGLRTTEHIFSPGPNGKVVRVTYHDPSGSSSDIIVNYTQISDPFGPTITDRDISALVISAETRAGGKAVNDRRREQGWKELEVFEVGILDPSEPLDDEMASESKTESFASKISSTDIRRRLQEKAGLEV
jgi:phosphopantetheine adenylyltransferase